MLLTLINPSNPLVAIVDAEANIWNRYRVWQPLGLMAIAGLTPPDWKVTLVDENLGIPDYTRMQRPDLVGITAFTSQAPRAYELAATFRKDGVPVVLGGIHATMRREEASRHADAVVTGEAERVWGDVLADARGGRLRPWYDGGLADLDGAPQARHDLLPGRYAFGSVQTTRGCPLHCGFCSVTAFNGATFRQRPIDQVVAELANVPEKRVLIVDDNLVGTKPEHIRRAKELFAAMIRADLKKQWVAQATINVANDEELLSLAALAGCKGLFIGFESAEPRGSSELVGKNRLCRCRDLEDAVARIRAHGIIVAGSFIIGLEGDAPGVGRRIADAAERYGVDFANVLFLTPLPGTEIWERMEAHGQIALRDFPGDWGYYTLTYPVARYPGLTVREAILEMISCSERFYALPRILRRLWRNLWRRQSALIGLVGSLSYRRNNRNDRARLGAFEARIDARLAEAGGGAR